MGELRRQPLAAADEAVQDGCRKSSARSPSGKAPMERWNSPVGSPSPTPEMSLIPPVPRVVESFVRSGSRIPRPEYSSLDPTVRSGRGTSEDCVFSPKGMDPCRFASIRHKFEAMQVLAAKTCSANKALTHSQSEPVERAQRIAESLARLEQDFPQVGKGMLGRSRTDHTGEDKEEPITILRDYLSDIGMSTSPDLYDESTFRDVGEDLSPKRKSAGVHMSVSSYSHPEDVSVESEQTARSLDTGPSRVSLNKKPIRGVPTAQAGHKEADSCNRSVYMTEESDSVMMHLREDASCLRSGPNHSDFVDDSAGRGLQSPNSRNVKMTCNKTEKLRKVVPISEDCKVHNPCQFSPRHQTNSPESMADVDRSTTPCSLACVSEARASYRRSRSRVSGSMTGGSFDSMWSLEVSDSCAVRAHCNEDQNGPLGQVYCPNGSMLPRHQNSKILCSPTESLEVSSEARENTECKQLSCGTVRTTEHADLDLLAAPDNQAKDLSERRVLYWGSLNERNTLHSSAVDHSLGTLLEERSAHTHDSDTNTNLTKSLIIESQASSGIGYNSPKHSDKTYHESLDVSCSRDPEKNKAKQRWSVTALEQLSLDIPYSCPQCSQSARGQGSKVVCRRSRTEGLAKYGFTFDLPEVMTSGDMPLDGDVVKSSARRDGDEASSMEDSASTVICGTPLTLRMTQTKWCPTLLTRVATAVKLFLPRSKFNKKSVASEPTYHDGFGLADPESPAASGCLPARKPKTGSHEKRNPQGNIARTYSTNPGGTKRWWKSQSHCRKEQQAVAGCGRLDSQSDAKCPESSVHKYSRRHMFIMDKIENERLGKSMHLKRRGGQEGQLGWNAVQTT